MAGLLTNFRTTLILGLILAALLLAAAGFVTPRGLDREFLRVVLNWGLAVSALLWLGLLCYFNFVQFRVWSQIPAEQKQIVNLYITPEALFWVRWASLATILFGACAAVAHAGTYLAKILTFGFFKGFEAGDQAYVVMGVGAWLALLMFVNTWVVIWPNQRRALNIGQGAVELDEDTRAKAARVAMLATRVNLLLSIPMLTYLAVQPLFG
ncbi:hypothetical protein [Brevundimonas goettingensis]|uniref:Urate oxidase N-terminal domain-containing protein n=1 Tax=Brevundimonas goettingensis TaxID=2774190 RepID=A0A975BYM9_9CAUL|nr:hypothetical protein [Brevundimonas goettingensis]QTC89780.1 hypothetical protein IFJ75_10690 [Brevundimonas goettingensis]